MPAVAINFSNAAAALISVVGITMGAAYLLRPGRVPAELSADDPLVRRLKRILARRRFAAVMMITIAICFVLGVKYMQTSPQPSLIYFWIVLLLLLVWLVILALLDVVQVGYIRREIVHRSRQRLSELVGGARADHPHARQDSSARGDDA